MKIIGISTLSNYRIQVTFDDGISGIVDLREFIENGIFSKLKDDAVSNNVYITGHSIA